MVRIRLLLVFALAACGDKRPTNPEDTTGSTGPTGPVALTVSGLPDTIRRPGVEFTFDRTPLGQLSTVTVLIDGGAQIVAMNSAWVKEAPISVPVLVPAPMLANGTHAFRLEATSTSGKKGWAEFTRVVAVSEVSYSASFLGANGWYESRAADINAAGEVVGTLYSDSTTPKKPFVWRAGVMTELPVPSGAINAQAISINDVGDILGSSSAPLRGQLWRGDTLSGLTMADTIVLLGTSVNNSRRAIVVTSPPNSQRLMNLDAMTTVFSVTYPRFLNDAGQIVGEAPATLYSQGISTFGGAHVAYPPPRPGNHDLNYRGERYEAFGLDNAGGVLGRHFSAFSAVFYSNRIFAVYLDEWIPPPSVLSPSGEAFALVAPNSLYVWSAAGGTRRITLPVTDIVISQLVGANAAGKLIARGSRTSTGEHGAILLSPIP
jgi:hypothetical protein